MLPAEQSIVCQDVHATSVIRACGKYDHWHCLPKLPKELNQSWQCLVAIEVPSAWLVITVLTNLSNRSLQATVAQMC